LNFLLFQVEFLKLVAGGDHVAALKVASSHLGPIAASNQALLKPLKETLVTLIQPSENVLTKAVSLPVLASSLQVCFYVYICCKLIQSPTHLVVSPRLGIHCIRFWFCALSSHKHDETHIMPCVVGYQQEYKSNYALG
jgi:hypothetical protein